MMDAQSFCYWLHGFTELTRGQTPDPAQWKAIREHLDSVFKKVTPAVAPIVNPTISPSPTIAPTLPLTWPSTGLPVDWMRHGPICGVAQGVATTGQHTVATC